MFLCTQSANAQKHLEYRDTIYPVPSKAQLRWHEMEMNAFVHFTINTFTDKEWGYGNEDPALFNPTNLDAGQWVLTLKEAGFKGVILTAKHHDGFCLWPSAYTKHSIASSPYKNGKGDLVKEVSEACKLYGLRFGIYVSPWDRNRADYGQPSYIEYYRNQLKELFTNYGPIFEMWFDGANGGDGYYGGANEKRPIDGRTYYDWPNTLKLVKSMQPDVIFFSDAGPGVRWVGNESGEAGETNWNTITPDTLYAGKPGIEKLLQTGSVDGTAWIPAEVDVSIRPGWFYHEAENKSVKSGKQLFEIYLKSVGRGSNLLLNVAPDKRGLLWEEDVKALKKWKTIRDKAFSDDLAIKAKISVNSVLNNDTANYGVYSLNDADLRSGWIPSPGSGQGVIEIELTKTQTLNYLILQEYISLGQRVTKFIVEAYMDGVWKIAGTGTTVGYKRILALNGIKSNWLRISFPEPKSLIVIANLELY